MTAQEIRKQFIDFFVQKHGHTFVPSSPVVPLDDPTLLFTNAGMNQFKPIFLGQERRSYVRAVNSQKCIRAGGKHNDLDDVGVSRRHHTFFEMLGNWSFGDYFKRGAIEMAWELLTKVWKLDASRLHVSCFKGDDAAGIPRDDEAVELWQQIAGLPRDHIHLLGKENFWEMGETGPCGPCTEIFIDRTPGKTGGPSVVSGDDPRVMEFWNLVFIQYNRSSGGRLEPLPAKHVDTGMGLERLCQILENKSDNYATELWQPYFEKITALTGRQYTGTFPPTDTASPAVIASATEQLRIDIAFRVIADHARMSTFAICDGARPDNKGRDSVVRSVIRRAVRFGYQVFGLRKPFLHELVPIVVQSMGEAFPELRRDPGRIASIISTEESAFLATIERGLGIFEQAAARGEKEGKTLSGRDAFELHTTYGFPLDLTMQLSAERGLSVDHSAYDQLFHAFVEESGKDRKQHTQVTVDLTAFAKTDDSGKYSPTAASGTLLGWAIGSDTFSTGKLATGMEAALLLDKTSFYAEQGGQVGDRGEIVSVSGRFAVADTQKRGDHVLHVGKIVEGELSPGQQMSMQVDAARHDTMRNHTVTHLLNWALRRVLGDHVDQKGSLVDAEHLRFDFVNEKAVTHEQLAEIERLVNERIYADLPVSATVIPLAEARQLAGVRAIFGERYPDPVRVIAIGTEDVRREASADFSVEFCGGTHLHHTGQGGFFKIVSEESVSKGVRRITGVTGRGAVRLVQELDASLRQISQALSVPASEAPKRVIALLEEHRSLKKKGATASMPGLMSGFDPAGSSAELLKQATEIGGAKLIVGPIANASDDQLRSAVDSLKKKCTSFAILLASAVGEKVSFVAAASDDVIARGLKAGDWVREAAKTAGGGGGGRPQLAQAGGKDPSKLEEALAVGKAFAVKALGG
jgi:alanyl-tRNA synthetase